MINPRRFAPSGFRAALLAAVVLTAPLYATTVVLISAQDATLYQDTAGDLANGAGRAMFAGRTASGSLRRGLVRFDLSSVPAGAIITGVTLSMHVTRERADSVAVSISLHEVNQSWGEGLSNAGSDRDGGGTSPTANDATWIHRFHSSSLWNAQGGDFDASASASMTIDGTQSYSWTGSGLVVDVQSWVDGGSPNNGWLFKGGETVNRTARRFATHEEENELLRPSLSVSYIPEPTTGLLCLLAVMFQLGHRKRAGGCSRADVSKPSI